MNLKAYLKGRGKKAEFARDTGISKSHLSLIVNGKRGASWPTAQVIEKATKGKVRAVSLLATPKRVIRKSA